MTNQRGKLLAGLLTLYLTGLAQGLGLVIILQFPNDPLPAWAPIAFVPFGAHAVITVIRGMPK
jgi:hypothetical protein